MNSELSSNLMGNQQRKNNEETEEVFDLIELIYKLLDNIAYVCAAVVACAVAAALITALFIPKQYTATSKLYVLNKQNSAINLSDLQIGNYLASDYKEVFENRIVHETVIRNLNLPYSVKRIRDKIDITNPADTRILYISAKADTPEEAKSLANEYARVAREFIASVMDSEQPNMFEDAVLPTVPSSPSMVVNVVIGAIIGFLFVFGIIVVRFFMDDRIRNSDDVEKYIRISTLGMLPLIDNKATYNYGRYSKKGNDRK